MDITLSSFLGNLEDKIITFYNEVDIKISRCAEHTDSRLRITFDIMTSDPNDHIINGRDTIYIDHNYNNSSYQSPHLNPSEQRALLKDIIETIDTDHENLIKRASVTNVLVEINRVYGDSDNIVSANTPFIKAMTMPIEDFVIALDRQSLQYNNDTRLNINDVTLKPQRNDDTGLDDYLFTVTVSNMTSRINVSFIGIEGLNNSPYDPGQHINKHQQFEILTRFVKVLDQTMGVANINQTIDAMIDGITDELFKIE